MGLNTNRKDGAPKPTNPPKLPKHSKPADALRYLPYFMDIASLNYPGGGGAHLIPLQLVYQVKYVRACGRIFTDLQKSRTNGDCGMSGFNKGASVWLARVAGAGLLVGMCTLAIGRVAAQQAEPAPWVAPDDAKKVKNPIPPTAATLTAAEGLFTDNCVLCHGEKGMGDGPGAKTIKVKPANFTDPKLQASETDGALFW